MYFRLDPDWINYCRARCSTVRPPSPRVPHVYEGHTRTRAHVYYPCATRVRGAHTRGTTRVLSAPTADSVTVRFDPRYSSPLQCSGTVVL